MRRKDREISDRQELLDIIGRCEVCRVALHDEPFPYIVPLNYGFEEVEGQMVLYFHCAHEGKKLDLIAKNSRVCFEIDRNDGLITTDNNCTMRFESVIGTGIIERVTDHEQKRHALDVLMRQYGAQDAFVPSDAMIRGTCVLRLCSESLTGKRLTKPGKI